MVEQRKDDDAWHRCDISDSKIGASMKRILEIYDSNPYSGVNPPEGEVFEWEQNVGGEIKTYRKSSSGDVYEVSSGGSSATAITRLRLARPYLDSDIHESAIHLTVQLASLPDFSDAQTVIDTDNVSSDRQKVLAFDGNQFIECPAEGLGSLFGGQPVIVNLSEVTLSSYVRYKWVTSNGDSDWYATYLPSTGEAYICPPSI